MRGGSVFHGSAWGVWCEEERDFSSCFADRVSQTRSFVQRAASTTPSQYTAQQRKLSSCLPSFRMHTKVIAAPCCLVCTMPRIVHPICARTCAHMDTTNIIMKYRMIITAVVQVKGGDSFSFASKDGAAGRRSRAEVAALVAAVIKDKLDPLHPIESTLKNARMGRKPPTGPRGDLTHHAVKKLKFIGSLFALPHTICIQTHQCSRSTIIRTNALVHHTAVGKHVSNPVGEVFPVSLG